MVEVVTTEDRGKCIKLFARIAKKNAKSLLSQEKTVRCTARTVFQSIKIAAADFPALHEHEKPVSLNPGGLFYGKEFLWTINGYF